MTAITVDFAAHTTLESEFDAYLRSLGFLTFAAPYHETMPPEIQRRLQFRDSYTSLYLRARADRVAVHETLPLEFEWEVKTHDNSRYADLCIELLPFLHHIQKANLGVRCLYVFRIPHTSFDGCFWVHRRPPVREVWITSRAGSSLAAKAAQLIPEARIVQRDPRGGTKDPFVIIDKAQVSQQKNWRVAVQQVVTATSDRVNAKR